jgi:hypothetical protein
VTEQHGSTHDGGRRNGSELSPLQAGLRFLIEIAAIVCWGIVGWQVTDGVVRWLLVIALPLAAAIMWGTLRAPGDHSANGQAPIPVPGIVRLAIELDLLLGAAIVTAIVWRPWVGIVLGAVVVVHYLATLPRIRWLLDQRLPTA